MAAKKAEVFQRKKLWDQAIESMQLAHRLEPSNPDYQTEVWWLSYLACETDRPAKLERVRDQLSKLADKAPQLLPSSPAGGHRLPAIGGQGRLRASTCSEPSHLDPNDIDVIRELRLHTSRKRKREEDKPIPRHQVQEVGSGSTRGRPRPRVRLSQRQKKAQPSPIEKDRREDIAICIDLLQVVSRWAG